MTRQAAEAEEATASHVTISIMLLIYYSHHTILSHDSVIASVLITFKVQTGQEFALLVLLHLS